MQKTTELHAIMAIIFYAIDAFVFSLPLLTFVIGSAMILNGVVHIVRGFWGDRLRIIHGIYVILIYAIVIVCVTMTILVDCHIARGRGDRIVVALRAYKVKHGDYPENLHALVPEQMPEVPRARHTLLRQDFDYTYDQTKQRGPLLWFMTSPEGRSYFLLDGEDGWN